LLLFLAAGIAYAATNTNTITAKLIVLSPDNVTVPAVQVTNSSQLSPSVSVPSPSESMAPTWLGIPGYCVARIAGNGGAAGLILCIERAIMVLRLL
jgi:hypothetical protein